MLYLYVSSSGPGLAEYTRLAKNGFYHVFALLEFPAITANVKSLATKTFALTASAAAA